MLRGLTIGSCALALFLFGAAGSLMAQEKEVKLILPSINEPAPKKTLTIGILANGLSDFESGLLQPTLAALKEKIPQYHFETLPITEYELYISPINKAVDFYVAPSGTFAYMQDSAGAVYLAGNLSASARDPQHAAGALVIARADNEHIRKLTDLRNKRVATPGRESFFGMQVVLNELRRATERPDQFFRAVTVPQGTPEMLKALLAGKVDAVILKSCELEYMQRQGMVDRSLIKPVGVNKSNTTECLASTPLYPDLVFAAGPHVDSLLNTKVSEILLSMGPTEAGHRWVVANDFRDVIHVIRRFVSTPLTPENLQNQLAIWRYRYAVFLGVILLLGSVLFGFAVSKMVQNRTRELVKTLEQNKQLENAARKDRERLMQLEKVGIVSELSSIIAHEARQPVTSLINYADGLAFYLKDKKDPIVDEATREISQQALRISNIVQRVRSYAKRQDSVHVKTDLVALVLKALQTVRSSEEINNIVLVPRVPRTALISCDPFEIELVIVNLTRNALQAVAPMTDIVAYVEVGVKESDDQSKWILYVRDNGPVIGEEKIRELSKPVHSDKIEGLGLGLSICRVIAERHSTRIQFEQLQPRGLLVTLDFEKLQP